MDNAALFDRLKADVSHDWKALGKWRDRAEDDFAFEAGHQWSDLEEREMTQNQRIPIVFNRVAPIIASVAGFEINNRTQVRYIPREIGDVKPNEILTAGAEWFRDQSDAEDEESQAFRDVLICGIGWTETSLDFTEDAEGRPSVVRIPPVEMCWDSQAYRKGLRDANRVARVRCIPMREAKEMFPGVDTPLLSADWLDMPPQYGKPNNNISGDQYMAMNAPEADDEPDTVTIVQVQWREKEKRVEYVEPSTGQPAEASSDEWAKLKKMGVPVDLIPHRTKQQWRWQQAFLGKAGILGEVTEPCRRAATFQAITGHYDLRDKMWYGLLRVMRDPQRFANKWLSTTLHIMASNAKGGVMVEEDAVSDAREFEESWAAADSISWVKAGRLGGIQEKSGVNFPAPLMNLTEFAISSIRDVSGVNMEILGMREANQPGILEYQRRQSAMVTLSHYFDNLRFYRKRQGEVILHFLRDHIAPTGRLVRIVKEEQAQYVPLAVDSATRDYDVIVDDAPTAPNEKEKAWSVISEMMPMLLQAGLSGEDWADILEYSPLPSSFAEKVRAKASQQQEDPAAQMQQQAMMAELQKLQAEIERLRSQSMLDQARAQEIATTAQIAPFKAMAEAQQAQADAARAQGDMRLKEQDAMVRAIQGVSAARKNEATATAALMKPPTPAGA